MNIEQHIASLNSPSLVERMAADCALIDAGAAEALLAVLNDETSPTEARWRAAANLGDIGDASALESLVAAVTDASWEVRASAIWALGMLRNLAGFETLQTIAENPTPDEQNSYVAAMGLLRTDQTRAVDVLRRASENTNPRVRSWGRSALASLEY